MVCSRGALAASVLVVVAMAVGAMAEEQLNTNMFTLYDPATSGFLGSVGNQSGDAGQPAGYSGEYACTKGGAAVAVCHQAGMFTKKSSLEPNQQALQMLGCEITTKDCGLGVGQIHGMGLAFNGDWSNVNGQSIYPVSFSVIGGTKAYANVIGGTVEFTQSDGVNFNLRLAK